MNCIKKGKKGNVIIPFYYAERDCATSFSLFSYAGENGSKPCYATRFLSFIIEVTKIMNNHNESRVFLLQGCQNGWGCLTGSLLSFCWASLCMAYYKRVWKGLKKKGKNSKYHINQTIQHRWDVHYIFLFYHQLMPAGGSCVCFLLTEGCSGV